MTRSVGRIEGGISRRTYLPEDTSMHTKNNELRNFPKSTMVDEVFIYDLVLQSTRVDYSEEEMLEVENAVKILFVKYGEKCANSSFFLKKMNEEFPKFQIDSVYIDWIERFYKTTLSFMRGGSKDYSSKTTLLHLQKNDSVDPITV